MNNHQAAEEYIKNYREELMRKMPFYGEILSHLSIVDNRNVETVCTDGRSIHYNCSFLMKKTIEERNYILMHELLHVLFLHCVRGIGKEQIFWNIATDYVVNGILDNMAAVYALAGDNCEVVSLKRPDEGTFYDNYSEESAEELYRQIYEDNKGVRNNWLIFKTILLRDRYGENPSGTHKVVAPVNLDLKMVLSDVEAQILEKEMQGIIDSALKSWSGDPSIYYIQRVLGELRISNRLSWKSLLKRFLTEYDLEDTSYDTPERKYIHMDLILPGAGTMESNKLDGVWAFIDCSGSISLNEINDFRNELYTICKQFDTQMNIAYWDVSVRDVYENITADTLDKCLTHYSGGTDPTCIYTYMREHKIDPNVLIILSDGVFDRIDNYYCKKYRSKTILVLSYDDWEDCSYIGKVAKLK